MVVRIITRVRSAAPSFSGSVWPNGSLVSEGERVLARIVRKSPTGFDVWTPLHPMAVERALGARNAQELSVLGYVQAGSYESFQAAFSSLPMPVDKNALLPRAKKTHVPGTTPSTTPRKALATAGVDPFESSPGL